MQLMLVRAMSLRALEQTFALQRSDALEIKTLPQNVGSRNYFLTKGKRLLTAAKNGVKPGRRQNSGQRGETDRAAGRMRCFVERKDRLSLKENGYFFQERSYIHREDASFSCEKHISRQERLFFSEKKYSI
jgi:hypothetical protein